VSLRTALDPSCCELTETWGAINLEAAQRYQKRLRMDPSASRKTTRDGSCCRKEFAEKKRQRWDGISFLTYFLSQPVQSLAQSA
jgi:hypothetical protein